jgi:iron complex transport system substrate-binding protein
LHKQRSPTPPRVVSLIAGATEIVAALGRGGGPVGRGHECDFPPELERLPALTAPNFEVRGTSAEIDARVRQIVREALSVYRADARALRALAPDVILTQDHCEVCAASLADVDDVRRTAGEARRRRTRSSRSSSRL